VTQRQRFDRLPVTIGRGYENDVVLDDPQADAVHARITAAEDGRLVVEDLGSLNGTQFDGRELRIGRTQLRVGQPGQPMPPAVAAAPPPGRLLRLAGSRAAAGVVPLIGVLALLFYGWISDAQNDESAILGFAVVGGFLVAGWAGGWALAGRLAIHQSRFFSHHVLAWAGVIVMFVMLDLFAWGDFLTESGLLEGLSSLAMMALIIAVLSGHLALASRMTARQRVAIAAGITIGFSLLGMLLANAGEEYTGESLTITANLKPAPAALVPAISVESFLERSLELQREIDELAERE
jgi:hypothetical protein